MVALFDSYLIVCVGYEGKKRILWAYLLNEIQLDNEWYANF